MVSASNKRLLITTPILKKSPMVSSARKRVLFANQETARSVILKYRESGNPSHFTNVFKDLSVSGSHSDLLLWLSQMTECVSLLDRKADNIVLEFLKIPFYKSEELASAAENFFITLVTAHNYYAYLVLEQLFTFLIPDVDEQDKSLLEKAGFLSEEEKAFHKQILSSIVSIHNHVPLIRDKLLVLARKCMPYFRQHVHQHAVYTQNLLHLCSFLPHLRVGLLEIIITNMATIDVHIPRSALTPLEDDNDEDEEEVEEDGNSEDDEIFNMTLECESKEQMKIEKDDDEIILKTTFTIMDNKDGNTLDVLMIIMLQYVHNVCHGIIEPGKPTELGKNSLQLKYTWEPLQDGKKKCRAGSVRLSNGGENRTIGCECGGSEHDIEAIKLLFTELKEVFSNIILCTHSSSHVQFLLFYLLALRPGLATIFLDFLRIKKFENPSCSRDIRRNAMAYIGSLLARGKYIPFIHVNSCLELICAWCSTYLENQERMQTNYYEDLLLHLPFYYACQTVFYVFTFRYREYTENSKRLELARKLNLERLVMNQLNPLRMCAAPIVNNFAVVARRFQLAYCYTIMENNKRLGIPSAHVDGGKYTGNMTLDMFFPFDPYLLQRSKVYISDHYREFDGLPEDVSQNEDMDVNADEALDIIMSPKTSDFSYSLSPGFKKWHSEPFSVDSSFGFIPS
ncbi:RNA polymerase I-specific transcription initiation factor RRN3 isoform X2 [Cherax quadricarinatus]